MAAALSQYQVPSAVSWREGRLPSGSRTREQPVADFAEALSRTRIAANDRVALVALGFMGLGQVQLVRDQARAFRARYYREEFSLLLYGIRVGGLNRVALRGRRARQHRGG